MRVERGQSQILFGMLPAQTVDLQGAVWRVKEWPDAQELSIDQGTLRNGLQEAIAPWAATGNDNGLANELRGGARVQAVSVNRRMGVEVDAFPKQ